MRWAMGCSSGAKALEEAGFIAAPKALRHPNPNTIFDSRSKGRDLLASPVRLAGI